MFKVSVELKNGRKWVKRAMIATKAIQSQNDPEKLEKALKWRLTGKRMAKMLIAKESPIEEMEFWIDLYVPERVHTHLVRHKEIGKYVATSRPDIFGHTSIEDGMRFMSLRINAKRLIEISEQRLCLKSWMGTVRIWKEVVKQCIELEPMLIYVLHKPCVKCGYCIKTSEGCDFNFIGSYEQLREDINKLGGRK